MVHWAKKACISANCLPSPENIRAKLGNALKLIRFEKMSIFQFIGVVCEFIIKYFYT